MLPHWVEAPSHEGTSLRIGHSISLLLLSERFVMKDPGLLNYFLGIEVTYSPNGLFYLPQKYATELLIEAGVADCKSSPSPLSSWYV